MNRHFSTLVITIGGLLLSACSSTGHFNDHSLGDASNSDFQTAVLYVSEYTSNASNNKLSEVRRDFELCLKQGVIKEKGSIELLKLSEIIDDDSLKELADANIDNNAKENLGISKNVLFEKIPTMMPLTSQVKYLVEAKVKTSESVAQRHWDIAASDILVGGYVGEKWNQTTTIDLTIYDFESKSVIENISAYHSGSEAGGVIFVYIIPIPYGWFSATEHQACNEAALQLSEYFNEVYLESGHSIAKPKCTIWDDPDFVPYRGKSHVNSLKSDGCIEVGDGAYEFQSN
jgi:hypothetical protein